VADNSHAVGTLVSIIVPVFNEEELLPKLLESINKYLDGLITYEIIVVDNGSEDNSAKVAIEHGLTVISKRDAPTVASVRNHGALQSKGEILVFLDADVEITQCWANRLTVIVKHLLNQPLIVTGSRVSIPEPPTWLEKNWFGKLPRNGNYINTANLITTKSLFSDLEGFDNSLISGEDADFCIRAKRMGAKIFDDPELKVIHHGFPKSIIDFIKREIWHGRGDYKSFSTITESQVAIASIIIISLHLISLILTIFAMYKYTIMALGLIFIFSLICTLYKFNFRLNHLLPAKCFICYVYLFSRGISFITEAPNLVRSLINK